MRTPWLAVPLILAGCATIDHGTSEVVTIQPDQAGATCIVWEGLGGLPMPVVGGKARVPRSRFSLYVECQKPGFYVEDEQRIALYNERTAFGPGSLVDIYDGANYGYPAVIPVRMRPLLPDATGNADNANGNSQ